jgi:hypothetical protein
MPKSILLPQFFLPLSAVSLGRFVISLDDPHQDFHNPTSNASPDFTEKSKHSTTAFIIPPSIKM